MKSNKNYNPSEIESKWQDVWEKEEVYSPSLGTAKKPFYNLMMFPYPSAEGMHVGNMYAFTGADVYGRFQRMQGKSVIEPIGLDGFGIHSENYAIKVKTHPAEQAKISEKNFYKQLKSIGNGFDWSRTVETYKPEYYKWTQWLFIQLFKAGLAYRKKAPVNFCPSCQTVLADEQVEDGLCERCNSTVEKRDLEQWFFKITKYADRLLYNLTQIDWSEKVKIAQKLWIGRSEGARISFEIDSKANYVLLHGFTGSPDANFFPWLKKELEDRGNKVYAPQLPNTYDPNIDEQVEFVLKNANFDENTILFGHSLGSVVALKIAEKLKKPIRKLVLAASFAQPKFLDHSRPFEDKFDWKFDFEKIKETVHKVVLLRAKNDTAVPQERSDYIRSKIGGEIVDFTAGNDHICGLKEPVVLKNLTDNVEVYTTRPDTLFGATFLVLSPEHPLVASLLSSKVESQKLKAEEIRNYVMEAKKKTDREKEKEKTGIFSGLYAINPVNNEKIPVWIADYVLMGYGTGAIMAVPAHDERDFMFAKTFGLKIQQVISGRDIGKEAYVGEGEIINSGDWSGWKTPESIGRVIEWLGEKGLGEKEVNFHLRDWLISRQRYWGPPIPLVFCENCAVKTQNSEPRTKNGEFNKGELENPGWIAVPEKDLPVELPFIKDYKPLGTGKAPLENHPEFYKTKCPNCGGEAKRETDVSDTFLDSSWYFLRYVSTDIDNAAFDTERVKKWLPVNMYIGGAEHSVLHLLYSRFITMVLKDLGFFSFEEPFTKFRAHGLIVKDGAKMSKSKGNVVIPDEYIRKFGADTLRTYLMFMGPFSQGGDFRDTGIEGMHRFLRRFWTLAQKSISNFQFPISNESQRIMHKTIKKVTEDLSNLSYNTAIAALMEWYNYLTRNSESGTQNLSREEIETFLKLIAPFAPHLSEELYSMINADKKDQRISTDNRWQSIHLSAWPVYDPKFLVKEEVVIIVQVNGKLRGNIKVQSSKSKVQSYVEELARQDSNVKSHMEGKSVRNVIYVEGKVINFVI